MSPHKVSTLSPLEDVSLYDISANGFLPATPPLAHLSDGYYQPWDNIIHYLPTLLETKQLRSIVDDLHVLSTSYLHSDAEWQRAYLVLTMIAQGYIWQGPEPRERLPPAISVPLLAVAKHLQVLPVATYAALNLWNWEPTAPGLDITNPDNLRSLHTFTGTDDESWFYVVSNAMEARGGAMVQSMLEAMQAVEQHETQCVVDSLISLERSLIEIGQLLERMYEQCDPQVFYYHIRPFLAGSKNMAAAGLPNGVFFDEGNGKGKWRTYRGGSNGQSSLIQFFDAVLGVQHLKTEEFHEEMRKYMPGGHARFLEDVIEAANIRDYVSNNAENVELTTAFNEAIKALTAFRDKHLQLVSRYIIIPSRLPPPAKKPARQDLAAATTTAARRGSSTQELVGTGGTKLLPFLKQARNDTTATALDRS